ncbi:MAG: bifunctional adenosylcobinamide kinase/adenosylcobinamide-phosphate guanylyltransferase [Candidatus Omnitrophota bacterium]
MSELVLLTGGVRSGKSRYAQTIASRAKRKVFYIATAEALDIGMRKRIQAHRKSRPKDWHTVEEPLSVKKAVLRLPRGEKTVIIDCLTLFISNLIHKGYSDAEVLSEIKGVMAALRKNSALAIIVTNEVGSGIVPDTALGRRFRDLQGMANSMAAKEAEKVCLLVSGIPLYIK